MCLNKGQYLAAVLENGDHIDAVCCQYSPSVQDHQEDACHELVIGTNGAVQIGSPPSPPSKPNNNMNPPPGKPPSGGGGQGKAPPVSGKGREEVVMELKATGPGQPTQLVKAIKSIK